MLAALAAALPDILPNVWQALFGGRTNAAWMGQTTQGDIVVKLYSGPAQNPLFPNDPSAEARLLRLLASQGFAPELLAKLHTDVGLCNVYAHIPGQTWQAGTPEVARLMRRLHGIAPLTGLRNTANGSAELISQTRIILKKCASGDDLAQFEPAFEPIGAAPKVLLHGDIVPGNLIRNAHGLHLIDWQCPAIGDPCEDIAIFLSPAMQFLYRGAPLGDVETEAFLTAYGSHDVTQRYHALAPYYHWRMAAYCLWQLENGRPDYAQGFDLERAALQRSAKP